MSDDNRPHAVAHNHVSTHYLLHGVADWPKLRRECAEQARRVAAVPGGGPWAVAYLAAVETEIAHYNKVDAQR